MYLQMGYSFLKILNIVIWYCKEFYNYQTRSIPDSTVLFNTIYWYEMVKVWYDLNGGYPVPPVRPLLRSFKEDLLSLREDGGFPDPQGACERSGWQTSGSEK